eukprot:TRINITY_DN204_c0_g1_i1.p1 TRINITY_DN204_c0_g1~~TRINITY_DN204_c0_g1_i1.p1  ORF type:complete len:161 (+),score=23.15 TRINITY_DN204_c0_g1_i1:159-641(+)
MQESLERLNPTFLSDLRQRIAPFLASDMPASATGLRPDGDSTFGEIVDFSSFVVPDCTNCGGLVKPNVVFFGENVPKATVAQTMDIVKQSDAMLILGTTLAVRSASRFAEAATSSGIPLAIVNLGETAMDANAYIKINDSVAATLEHAWQQLKTTDSYLY